MRARAGVRTNKHRHGTRCPQFRTWDPRANARTFHLWHGVPSGRATGRPAFVRPRQSRPRRHRRPGTVRLVRRIRAANHDARAGRARSRDHAKRVSLRHQVDGEAHHRRTFASDVSAKSTMRSKRASKTPTSMPRVSNATTDTAGRAGDADASAVALPHPRQENAVRQQDIHQEVCCGGRIAQRQQLDRQSGTNRGRTATAPRPAAAIAMRRASRRAACRTRIVRPRASDPA